MIKTVTASQLLKVQTELTTEQIQKFFTTTPANKIKIRPAKGGGQWKYVSGSYVTQVLNSLFGFNWSFSVDTSMAEALEVATKTGSVVVKGTLKVKMGDEWITKEQYGRKEVAFKKGTKEPLDFGNDVKAAATDAKKKCASELGLFADVYSQEDFFEAEIVEDDPREAEKAEAKKKAIGALENAKDVDSLKIAFMKLGNLISDEDVIAAKEKRKKELTTNASPTV